jgi:hypothetical protein
MQVSVVALTTCSEVQAIPPIAAPVAESKLVPVTVTVVPPAIGPPLGVTEDTVGAAS